MTGINRIGQKVLCIYDDFERDWCPDIKPLPVYNGVYTVSGFENYFEAPGIHLMEFTNTKCACFDNKRIPWPIICFRPLISDETKNEHVTKIVDKAKAPAPNKKVKEKV